MEVVFDPTKDDLNLNQHGISLARAKDFDFLTALFFVDDSQDYGEVRYRAIGWLDALLYSLVFTQSGETIRAISLRKSTRQERKEYAEEN